MSEFRHKVNSFEREHGLHLYNFLCLVSMFCLYPLHTTPYPLYNVLMSNENQDVEPPAPNFDFILKDQPKKRRRFGLPKMPKMLLVALAGVALVLVVIIVSSLFSGSGNTEKIYSLIKDGAQIDRISTLVSGQAKDPDTKNLAITTSSVLSSQEQQLTAYLTGKKVKIETKKITPPASAEIDNQLKAALLNNTYDQAYLTYLKDALAAYRNSLSETYKSAGSQLKTILTAAYSSTGVILLAPQFQ